MNEIAGIQKELQELFNKNFKSTPNAYQNYLECYWTKIFAKELKIVKQRAKEHGVFKGVIDTGEEIAATKRPSMLMTLGLSHEPLVLAVYLVQPENIIVLYTDENILNKFKEHLRTAATALKQPDCYSKKVKGIAISVKSHDEAATLFRLLSGRESVHSDSENALDELRNLLAPYEAMEDNPSQAAETLKKKLIFDITGAKKTISGGCYLFAAYYDIPVYYMDFESSEDAYNRDLGRPYPGRCYYTRQENPITGFGLKRLQNIRRAFDERRFQKVVDMLDEIIPMMQKPYFGEGEIERHGRIREVAKVYDDWQNGAYGTREGKHLGKRIKIALNLVEKVHYRYFESLSIFPSADKSPERFNAYYYDKTEGLCAYVCFELARIKRQTPLSSGLLFLRTFALEEFLLGFVFWKLISQNCLTLNYLGDGEQLVTEDDKKQFCNANYGYLEEHLMRKASKEGKIEIKQHNINLYGVRKKLAGNFCKLEDVFGDIELKRHIAGFRGDGWNKINRKKRDSLAHFTQPIHRGDVECLSDKLEEIWKYLLRKKPEWFNSEGQNVAQEYLDLMKSSIWHLAPPVAPLKYADVDSLLESTSKKETRNGEESWTMY